MHAFYFTEYTYQKYNFRTRRPHTRPQIPGVSILLCYGLENHGGPVRGSRVLTLTYFILRVASETWIIQQSYPRSYMTNHIQFTVFKKKECKIKAFRLGNPSCLQVIWNNTITEKIKLKPSNKHTLIPRLWIKSVISPLSI